MICKQNSALNDFLNTLIKIEGFEKAMVVLSIYLFRRYEEYTIGYIGELSDCKSIINKCKKKVECNKIITDNVFSFVFKKYASLDVYNSIFVFPHSLDKLEMFSHSRHFDLLIINHDKHQLILKIIGQNIVSDKEICGVIHKK